MAYKDKIYDITAWDMSKRLELFLNGILGADEDGVIKRTDKNKDIRRFVHKEKIKTLGDKIEYFCKEKFTGTKDNEETREMMREINDNRTAIVHPKNLLPVLDKDDFKKLQAIYFKLEDKMKIYDKKVRIKEVLPTLEYDMGNAGDIIKHGLLVEFIKWWGEINRDHTMKIADTFGGCPWDNMSKKIAERLEQLKGTRLSVIQRENQIITDAYMGSSFLMLAAAKRNEISVKIDVSDNDENARCNWDNVTSRYGEKINQSMGLMWPRLDNNDDGYNILSPKYAEKYDLILLDPYSEFLRNEFYSTLKQNYKPRYFTQILELVKRYPNLFIAVFVLDMNSANAVGRWYAEFKEDALRDYTFSLRCPKIPRKETEISGESKFNSEILLISQQIANRKCDELRKGLIDFAEKVTNALPLSDDEKVEFWPPHE